MTGAVIPFTRRPKRPAVIISPSPITFGWYIVSLCAAGECRPVGFATDHSTAVAAGEKLARWFDATLRREVSI
jgi:hypothetical protein